MIFKLLLLIAVITVVYFVFFKKKRVENISNKSSENKISGEELIPCYKCNVLTAENETIIHNGQQFCSKECAKI